MAYDDGDMNDSASHYINTLVFAVVAGIVSLMLLLLILWGSETVRAYSAFIITIEVGLVLIMTIAIGRIIYFERQSYKRSVNALDNRLRVNTCPDYWTRYGSSCYNTMVSPENSNLMFRMPKPDGTATSTYNINLNDYDGKSVREVCSKVDSKQAARRKKMIVAIIAWTFVVLALIALTVVVAVLAQRLSKHDRDMQRNSDGVRSVNTELSAYRQAQKDTVRARTVIAERVSVNGDAVLTRHPPQEAGGKEDDADDGGRRTCCNRCGACDPCRRCGKGCGACGRRCACEGFTEAASGDDNTKRGGQKNKGVSASASASKSAGKEGFVVGSKLLSPLLLQGRKERDGPRLTTKENFSQQAQTQAQSGTAGKNEWLYLNDAQGKRLFDGGVAVSSAWLRDGATVANGSCIAGAVGTRVPKPGSDVSKDGGVCFGGSRGADALHVVGKASGKDKERVVRAWDRLQASALQAGKHELVQSVSDPAWITLAPSGVREKAFDGASSDATSGSSLAVSGHLATVGSSVTMGDTVSVGDTYVGGSALVQGYAMFGGDASFGGAVNVQGPASFNGHELAKSTVDSQWLTLAPAGFGDAAFAQNPDDVAAKAAAGSSLGVSGGLLVQGDSAVGGSSVTFGDAYVQGMSIVNGSVMAMDGINVINGRIDFSDGSSLGDRTLCLGQTCLTEEQLGTLLSGLTNAAAASAAAGATTTTTAPTTTTTAPTTTTTATAAPTALTTAAPTATATATPPGP